MELTGLIATELLQRQAIKILYDNLNTKLDSLAAGWTSEDTDYFTSIGRSNPIELPEDIQAENFYPGTVPSLLNSTPDRYPNVCAFSWRGIPKSRDFDQGDSYNMTLMIEVMCKSVSSEIEVNSRTQRTLDAIHQVMLENRTVNHLVSPILPPVKSLGDVFVGRQDKTNRLDKWFWQGGYLEYNIDKFVNFN